MNYRFPTSRPKGITLETSAPVIEPDEPEEEPGLIQGQKARSKEEWWAAKALWKLKREFIYQYVLLGGTRRRGGLVIDFVLTDGPPIVIEIQGERWHTGAFSSGERLREAFILQYFGVKPDYIWGNECTTEYDTYKAVKKVVNG